MAEYIERENAYKLISEQVEEETGSYSIGRNMGLKVAKSIIHNKEQCPTADVVEVKHGKWEKQQFIGRSGFFSVKDFTCSNCFESFAVEQGKGLMNYCPNCGARMVKGV